MLELLELLELLIAGKAAGPHCRSPFLAFKSGHWEQKREL
jgi:hypothetical protein